MKFLNIVAGLSILIANIASADTSKCVITAGTSEYSPITYYDASKNLVGMDVELLDIIGKQAGCEIKWLPMLPWERVLNEIKSGDIMIAPTATDTEERRKYANMIPYRLDSTKVFVRTEDLDKLKDIHSLEDLISKTNFIVGIYTGYHYGSSFEKLYDNPTTKKRFEDIPDASMAANFLKLKAKRIDAVILETVVGIDLLTKNDFKGLFTPLSFELNDPGLDSMSNILVSKAGDPNGKYFSMLQNAYAIVKDSDEYKNVIKKYTEAAK